MTHPFHPLFGQEFEYVTHNNCWGVDRVFFIDFEGQVLSLPIQWTSAAGPDPFVILSAGRCILNFADLAALAKTLQELKSQFPFTEKQV